MLLFCRYSQDQAKTGFRVVSNYRTIGHTPSVRHLRTEGLKGKSPGVQNGDRIDEKKKINLGCRRVAYLNPGLYQNRRRASY